MTKGQRRRERYAKDFLRLGCKLVPLQPSLKRPATKDWRNRGLSDTGEMKACFRRSPQANYGVMTGAPSNLFVIDVDGPEGEKSLRRLESRHGALPRTRTVTTPHGRHLYFNYPRRGEVRNSASKLGPNIDVRGDGGYAVGPGSQVGGKRYRLAKNVPIRDAPKWLVALVADKARPKSPNQPASPLSPKNAKRTTAYADAALKAETQRVEKAPLHQRNDTLNTAAFKIGQLLPYGVLDKATVVSTLTAAAKVCGLEDEETQRTIMSGLSAGAMQPRKVPFTDSGGKGDRPKSSKSDLTRKLAKLGATDTDNAQRVVARFGRRLLWTPGTGWFIYDGVRWLPDRAFQRLGLAIKTAERIHDEAQYLEADPATERRKFSVNSKSKSSLDRMVACAQPFLAAPDDVLDVNPFQLNVLNGTVDLRTGTLAPHDSRDLITKLARVEFDPEAECPAFKQFLKRILPDPQRRAWVHKAVGYSLTGSTREQVLFFVHGPSHTGKSTLLNLLRDLLGGYGMHTPTETLVIKHHDSGIPADLARLHGARMVTAIEANFNKPLDEAKIKSMTGGDKITARYLHGNFFEYTPQFKLWIAANDFPRIRGTDNAMWNRIRVIPLRQVISNDERQQDLPDRLVTEARGILAWAVRGARLWCRQGLGTLPDGGATKEWRSKVDPVPQFIQDECRMDPEAKVSALELYQRYTAWCEKNGEEAVNMKGFKYRLVELDYTHKRIGAGSVWKGIRLRD